MNRSHFSPLFPHRCAAAFAMGSDTWSGRTVALLRHPEGPPRARQCRWRIERGPRRSCRRRPMVMSAERRHRLLGSRGVQWQAQRLEDNGSIVRGYLLDEPSSPLFDIVDRRALAALLETGPPWKPQQARRSSVHSRPPSGWGVATPVRRWRGPGTHPRRSAVPRFPEGGRLSRRRAEHQSPRLAAPVASTRRPEARAVAPQSRSLVSPRFALGDSR